MFFTRLGDKLGESLNIAGAVGAVIDFAIAPFNLLINAILQLIINLYFE